MNIKLTSEDPLNELTWDEAVSRFLEDHPDYFEHRPEVLARLKLSHDAGGRAVSLIERQVQALREREDSLNRQLRELIAIARENDVLATRVHRFSLAMLESRSIDDALDAAGELLRNEFRVESVAVRFADSGLSALSQRAELVAGDDARHVALLRQFAAGKPVCGGKFDDGLFAYLFGEAHRAIRSSALIPLGEKPARGVLALGCQDPQRFHSGMGTVYLMRLGELLTQALLRIRG